MMKQQPVILPMTRPYNFGAGPAALPETILETAQQELLDWHGTGMSIVEIGHRTAAFESLVANTLQDCRDVLAVPQNYQILFFTGPARSQFSAVPMNLFGHNARADYLESGHWSHMAYQEAQRYGDIHSVAPTQTSYTTIAPPQTWTVRDDISYFYYCANETIDGVALTQPPTVTDAPLVADMTSCLLSEPIDINRFGVIFAGTQKNIAPAGLTLVIVRDDLLQQTIQSMPSIWEYRLLAKHQSLLNTPATFSLYMAGLMFTWLKQEGGLAVMAARNARKAQQLYAAIDNSHLYLNTIDPNYRSTMNVTFQLRDATLLPQFFAAADQAGLLALQGHRSVGGCRASLYNAIPEAAVTALVQFMADFEARHYTA